MNRMILITAGIIIFPMSEVIADDGDKISVPEPSTILLLGFAIAALGFYLYWRSKKKKR